MARMGKKRYVFYAGFVAEIDRLEELVVDGIGPLELDFFGSECFT